MDIVLAYDKIIIADPYDSLAKPERKKTKSKLHAY